MIWANDVTYMRLYRRDGWVDNLAPTLLLLKLFYWFLLQGHYLTKGIY